ncbi:hypothetical protein [Acidisoma sp. C75]
MNETITLLQCARSLVLAKRITHAAITPYDQAKRFDGFTRELSGLADLRDLLGHLINAPRFCVVRGALAAGETATAIRRLVYDDPATGDVATLRDVPRRWLALDMEGIARPADLPAADLPGCAALAIATLPEAFHGAGFIAQATAGHGIKPGIRLRLWYWLSRSTSGAELRRWLAGCPADPSIFGAAQPIYTAAPIFSAGAADPIPQRLHSCPGGLVEVPPPEALSPPPAPPAKPLPAPGDSRAERYALAALRHAAAAVASAPVDSRHVTCRSRARGLARLVEARLLAPADVIAVMDAALQQAGKLPGEGAKVAAWAIAHPSTAKLPEGIA